MTGKHPGDLLQIMSFRVESGRRRNSAHDCTALHCIKRFIITLPSSQYDLNHVERDAKYQIIIIIIIIIWHVWVNILGKYGASSQIWVILTSRLLKSTTTLSARERSDIDLSRVLTGIFVWSNPNIFYQNKNGDLLQSSIYRHL